MNPRIKDITDFLLDIEVRPIYPIEEKKVFSYVEGLGPVWLLSEKRLPWVWFIYVYVWDFEGQKGSTFIGHMSQKYSFDEAVNYAFEMLATDNTKTFTG